jgi:hypothetical protein
MSPETRVHGHDTLSWKTVSRRSQPEHSSECDLDQISAVVSSQATSNKLLSSKSRRKIPTGDAPNGPIRVAIIKRPDKSTGDRTGNLPNCRPPHAMLVSRLLLSVLVQVTPSIVSSPQRGGASHTKLFFTRSEEARGSWQFRSGVVTCTSPSKNGSLMSRRVRYTLIEPAPLLSDDEPSA